MNTGLCNTHYKRKRRGEDMTAPIRGYRLGWTTQHGYREVFKDGRIQKEHRVVMEQHLGRPLVAHENVHHVNGERADNRPENLELWSTRQPKGQRIEDKIEFAIQILEAYAPALLPH